jgi:hypothetical protein
MVLGSERIVCMKTPEERAVAEKSVEDANIELRKYVDRPQDAPTDTTLHNELVERLRQAQAEYLDALKP